VLEDVGHEVIAADANYAPVSAQRKPAGEDGQA
jgi:hypothetical protein